MRPRFLLPLLLLSASCGTEPDPSADVPVETDVTEDLDPDVDDGPALKWLEIQDDPEAVAALDCSSTATPGADIDAARLYENPSLTGIVAGFEGCVWAEPGQACLDNSHSDPSQANGSEDSNAIEGFVSLNGGTIRCAWSGGNQLSLGNVLLVIEVSAGTTTEVHRVRACADPGGDQCGPWQKTAVGGQTHPAGTLFL